MALMQVAMPLASKISTAKRPAPKIATVMLEKDV